MSLVFCDSFDHYNTLSQKWTSNGGFGSVIDLSGTLGRTGIGCLLPAAIGPNLSVPALRGASPAPGYIMGVAFYQPGISATTTALQFIDVDPGGSGDVTSLFSVGPNPNLGLTCRDAFGTILGVSAPNLVVANAYNYIEAQCFFANPNGSAVVRLNGAVIFNLTGIKTVDPSRSSTGGECNQVRLNGAGGGAQARCDDFYVLNTSGAVNNSFLGPVNIYAEVPSANSAPLQWTPLAGTNFSEVNEIPPDLDVSYVSGAGVGLVDQYVYPITGIPGTSVVHALQHSLCSEVTTGSGSLGSCVNGIVAAGVGLGLNVYHFTPIQPYDTNPHTGAAWLLTDFPGTVLGPQITG